VFAKKSTVDCCAPAKGATALKDLTPNSATDPARGLDGCELGVACC